MNKSTKIAVTGASGFLGGHLVSALVSDGYADITLLLRDASRLDRVEAIVRRETGAALPASVRAVEVNFNNPGILEEALHGVEVVFNCAATVSMGGIPPEELIAGNVEIAAHMVDACLRAEVGLLVHVSSIAALGEAREGTELIDETCDIQRLNKSSAYSVSKFFSENEVRRGMAKGLKAVIVNPAIILGEGDASALGSACIIPVAAKGLPFYTEGVMGYVDVRDVARAMILLASEPKAVGERFILSAENLSYRDIISMSATEAGRKPPVIKAGQGLLGLASVLERPYALVRRCQRAMTRDVINNLTDKCYYDGGKVTRYVDFSYTPIKETVRRVVAGLK